MNDSQRKLVEDNMRLVPWVITHLYHVPVTEDLLSCGYLGLCAAAQDFDPERRAKFSTYAVCRIRNCLTKELRSLKSDTVCVPLESDSIVDEGAEQSLDLVDTLLSFEEVIRCVITLLLGGYSQTQIAQHLGVDRRALGRQLKSVREEIRCSNT